MDCSAPCDLITANKLNQAYGHPGNKAIGSNYDTQGEKNMHTANKAVGPNYDLQTEKSSISSYDSNNTDNKNIVQRFEMGADTKMNTIYVNADKTMSYNISCQKVMEHGYEQNNMTFQNMTKIPPGYGGSVDPTGRTYNTLKTVEMPYSTINAPTASSMVHITSNVNISNDMNMSNNMNNYGSGTGTVTTAPRVPVSCDCSTILANLAKAGYTNSTIPTGNVNTTGSGNMYMPLNASTSGMNSSIVTKVEANSGNNSSQNSNGAIPPCCNIESCPNNATVPGPTTKKRRMKTEKDDKNKDKDGKEKKKAKRPKGKRLSTPPSDPNSLLTLPETRQKWSHLTVNEKAIAVNVYKYVLQTMPHNKCRKEAIEISSNIMGVSCSTMYGILKEYRNTGKVSVPPRHPPPDRGIVDKLDDVTLTAIRRKVNELYLIQNKLPSLSKVLSCVNDDPDLPNFSRTTMYRILKKMNFTTCRGEKSKGVPKGGLILERPNLMNEAGSAVSVIRGSKPRKAPKKRKSQEPPMPNLNIPKEHVQPTYPFLLN